jgi:hypothetical protein
MKRFAVSFVLVAASLVACTNPDNKPATNAGSALDTIQKPTGSFGSNNAGDAFGSYDNNKNASSGLAGTGGGAGGSSSTQTKGNLRVLSNQVRSGTCNEGSSCACEAGGSFTYSRQSTDYGPAIQASFSNCQFADGNGFNGDMILLVSDKPLLQSDKAQIASDTTAGSGKSVLLAAEGTFTAPSEKIDAEVVFLEERGVDYLAVDVADGKIVIGVRQSDGLAVVYAKDTTWICQGDANALYTCQEQSSGQKVSASKSGGSSSGSSGSSGAPAPSGSSSSDPSIPPAPKG